MPRYAALCNIAGLILATGTLALTRGQLPSKNEKGKPAGAVCQSSYRLSKLLPSVKALTVLPDSAWGGRLSSLSVRLALRRGLVGVFLRFDI